MSWPGMWGVDRMYLGWVGWGIAKACTFGGFMVWYWIDVWAVADCRVPNANLNTIKGCEWRPYEKMRDSGTSVVDAVTDPEALM